MKFSWAEDSLNNVNPNITLDQFSETIIFESSYVDTFLFEGGLNSGKVHSLMENSYHWWNFK